jgi:uncharacterized membrane protein YgcG
MVILIKSDPSLLPVVVLCCVQAFASAMLCSKGTVLCCMCSLSLSTETITTRDTLIIFRPTYGTLGGIVISHSSKIQNLFQNLMTRFEENQWRSRGGGGGAGTGSRQRDYHNNQQESGEGEGGGGGGSSGDGQDEEWVAPIRNMMLRGRPASWTVAAAGPSSSTAAAAGSG